MESPTSQGARWISGAWAVLPIAAIAAFVLSRPAPAVQPRAAVAPVSAPTLTELTASPLDAPASRDEPLALYGQ